ncbi:MULTISPECIES: TatD family hydrolase [unclassified Leptolyngbya]|uniref:TatD family hydrolase n=1 Tax=unclassified Leptolyngbya TaxID=2650499 RepID=UPI0016871D9C|nr:MULTISPECIES: TatD family hydrolase [unclassified Leptolyngbya]MBD1912347.1 TatD family hydrolase [Leptolyngbya sp. FACHB-8]MBD2158017.1 TatD family hydrolase [Leptolyngbya sp. FACHB-16]
MQLIDTHVHLNFDSFQPDLDDVARQWREAGVVQLVHSCVEPAEFSVIKGIADRFPEISFAVGLHPLDAEKWMANSAEQIFDLARSDARIVAIGEIGLDFYKAENHEHQIQVFEAQLAIAHTLDLPVIIHCRDAAAEMAELLRSRQQRGETVCGVMHCWSGTPEETQWFLDLGFYVSFSGIVTFKNAQAVHASAQMVPANRLLIETDCPFLAPVPHRGERRNQPAYVRHVAERVAELRQESVETIATQTTANARHLFKLPDLPEATPANESLAIS